MGDHRGLLSRTEGCWTFDARDRMPRSSRLPVHAIIVVAGNATDHDAVTLPRERVRSSARRRHRRPSLRMSAFHAIAAVPLCRIGYFVADMIESFELWPESNGQAGSFRRKRPSSRTRASD